MGTNVSEPLTVPAWCDPESRNYRLSWQDILVGLLVVDDERFVFATPSGVKFSALRSESRLQWRRGKGFGMIPQFDLMTPHGSFRFYLSRPSTTAPLYDPNVTGLRGVVGVMSGAEDFRQVRQGRDAARALREKLGSP